MRVQKLTCSIGAELFDVSLADASRDAALFEEIRTLLLRHKVLFLRDHHFAFFFAPRYHPAFKHIGTARKLCADRGQRTIFNFLGPLLNPVRPSCQLMGVPRPELCAPIARVLKALGARRGMVVSGLVPANGANSAAHLDELSTLGGTTVAEFYQDRGFSTSALETLHFPLQKATLADKLLLEKSWNQQRTRARAETLKVIYAAVGKYREEQKIELIAHKTAIIAGDEGADISDEIVTRLKGQQIKYGSLPEVSTRDANSTPAVKSPAEPQKKG